jgi:DNA-binding transcriptional ArsR family regulator
MVAPKQSETDPDRCHVRIVHINRVAKARSEIAPARELEHLARIYNLLGNPTRLKIVMALKSGEMCVCDLAAFIGLSESAVSHQLRRLKDLALVRNRRAGQILYYSLDDDHVSDLLEIGLAHIRE